MTTENRIALELGQTLLLLQVEHERAVSTGDYDFYEEGKCAVCAVLIRHGIISSAHDADDAESGGPPQTFVLTPLAGLAGLAGLAKGKR